MNRWTLEMVTASSATICKYFCSLEEVEKCQAAIFLAPDACYFVTGINFQISSDDAKKLEGHIIDTNIFYHISSDDSVIPQKHEPIEKVILSCPLIPVLFSVNQVKISILLDICSFQSLLKNGIVHQRTS